MNANMQIATRGDTVEHQIFDVGYRIVDENAVPPSYDHRGDSGIGLCSVEDVVIEPNQITLVDTGIQFDIPEGLELCVRSRSGMTKKNGIVVAQGVGTVDQCYRGNVFVLLHNISDKAFHVQKGMKVAQGVFNELPDVVFHHAKELSVTSRGEGCLNSTGTYGVK